MTSLASASDACAADNARGSLLMVAAMGAFAVNDALVKFASAAIGTGQIMFVRGLVATAILAVAAAVSGSLRHPRGVLGGAVSVRAVADVLGTLTYIAALAALPLANVSAIFQALPLTVTVGAVLFLGERQGWRRWLAILVGLFGVLVILRPGTDGFSLHSILVIASVFFCAIRDLSTRRVPRETPGVLVALVTAVAVTLSGGGLTLVEGWRPVDPGTMTALMLSAVTITCGYLTIVAATRTGDVGVVAPFRYSILVFAIVLGVLVFDEIPSATDIVGGMIVVASGLYVIYRERRVRRPVAAAVAPTPSTIGPVR